MSKAQRLESEGSRAIARPVSQGPKALHSLPRVLQSYINILGPYTSITYVLYYYDTGNILYCAPLGLQVYCRQGSTIILISLILNTDTILSVYGPMVQTMEQPALALTLHHALKSYLDLIQ